MSQRSSRRESEKSNWIAKQNELKNVCPLCHKIIKFFEMRHDTITFLQHGKRKELMNLAQDCCDEWSESDILFLFNLYSPAERRKRHMQEETNLAVFRKRELYH